jgi:hypothetical protein
MHDMHKEGRLNSTRLDTNGNLVIPSLESEADAEQIGKWEEEALSLSEDGDTVAIGSF